MLKIRDFARLAEVSMTTLRYYDEIGLLKALSFADIATIASELTQRPIRRVIVPDDEFRAGMIGHGVPEPYANMFLGIYRASRVGEFARVDPTLTCLLKRPPISMRDTLQATISATR